MNDIKHIVMINPNAITRKSSRLLQEMEDIFQSKQLSYTFYTPEKEEDADAVYRMQKTPCRFYIFGGDGTLHRAVNHLCGTHHEIVLLPSGTGNDFSRMLKHHKNCTAHFYSSLNHKAEAIDVIKVNHSICINSACFALDHDIANHVHDTTWRFIPRKLAYLITVLRRIFNYRCEEVKVIINEKECFADKALFATCNNGKYYGGGFCMTPYADIKDGVMDICIIKEFPKWMLVKKCWALLLKRPQRLKECVMFQCQSAVIHTSKGVNLDGEGYNDCVLHIDILPASLFLVNELKIKE